ncbi:hypothetical protein G7068_11285 [Leucobacter viscericola]|uniref:SLH domain-containing protein n=1 Tax=Leucobacter viscericola TaxID=2714935 RepID=A0A6G7XGH3_9MICO|nr:invasin domain 3-containing protein [Leucobacter viscericola]QIK63704.1 hypothetical protein G7068_11285 [Leucobacter viscericola]
MLLSSIGLTAAPASAEQSPTDYGIYNVTLEGPPGGFALGDTGKVTFATYPTDESALPLRIYDGETIVRTLTMPNGLSLEGRFSGVDTCPGTGRNENIAYGMDGQPNGSVFYTNVVCEEIDNGNGTHSYQSSITYEVDRFFNITTALYGSINVKRTGPLAADAEVSISQNLTPGYEPSPGSQQTSKTQANPAPDLRASTIGASPDVVNLNTGSTSTITVQARDEFGTPLNVGGATLTGTSKDAANQDFGSLTPFQYAGGGKYTAQLTSTRSGVATVAYQIGGVAGTNTATVSFSAGTVDTGRSKTSYSVTTDPQPVKTGEHIVTVKLVDKYDNPVSGQGSSLAGTLTQLSGATLTPFTEDPTTPGTYLAKITSTQVGTALVSVTWATKPLTLSGNNRAEFVAGPVDTGHTKTSYSVSTGPQQVETGKHIVTVELVDADGNLVSGQAGALSGTLSGLAGATITGFSATTPGVYTAEVKSPTTSGTAKVAVNWGLNPVTLRGNGEALFEAGAVDLNNTAGKTNFTVSTTPQPVISGSHTVTVQLADKFGNPVTGKAGSLVPSTQNELGTGSVSPFSETAPGQYRATVTSSTSGGKVIKVAYNTATVGLLQNGNDTAVFIAGGVDLGHANTQYSVSDSDQVVGTGEHWVTVKLADSQGNPVSGQATGINATTTDDLGDGTIEDFAETSVKGTYTARVTSTISGAKKITAKFGSNAIRLSGNDKARFVATGVDLDNNNNQSNFTVSPGTASINGGSHTVTVLLADKYDNPVTGLAGKLEPSSAQSLGTGSISTFKEIGPGKYEARVTSSLVGDKVITVIFEGQVVKLQTNGNNTARFIAGGVDVGNSKTRYFVSGQEQPVGTGEHWVTVTLADASGNAVSGQATGITASTDNELGDGNIGLFTETATPGTYKAKVTSTVAGAKVITAKFGGSLISLDGNDTARFVSGDVDLENKDGKSAYFVSGGDQKVDSGAHTITVALADQYGNPVSDQQAKLTGSTRDSLGAGSITGFVESQVKGTYTATVTSTDVGNKVIMVVLGTESVKLQGNNTARFVAGDVDIDNKLGHTNYTVSTGPASIETGSHSVTVLLTDKYDNPVTKQAGLLKAATQDDLGSGTISTFQETVAGTYVAKVTSSLTGVKVITVTLGGQTVHLLQGGNSKATFISGGVDTGNAETKYSVSTGNRFVGTDKHTVTVSLADAQGDPVSGQQAGIRAATIDDLGDGDISDFTETTVKGTYTATVTSTVIGQKAITATYGANSVTLTGNGAANFIAGDVDVDNKEGKTSYTVSRGSVATGSGEHTITIKLADKYGNGVSMQSSQLEARTIDPLGTGSISKFSETATPGTYTAKITSSVGGTKIVTVTFSGANVSLENNGNDRAVFAAGGVDVDHSSTRFYVSGFERPVDTGEHTVTVLLADSGGKPVSGQANGINAATSDNLGNGGFSSFSETAAGVYTATVRSTVPGAKVVTTSFGGSAVTLGGNDTALFVSGTVDRGNTSATNYRVSTGAQEVGTGTHTITVTLADKYGNAVVGQASALGASTNGQLGAGFISAFNEGSTAGTYTARITSTLSGGKTIKVMHDGAAVSPGGTAANPANTVALFASTSVDLENSSSAYEVSTGEQPVVSGKHEVKVTLADVYGNPATGQAAKLKAATSDPLGTGKVTAFTETKTAGTYVASVSSSVVGSKVMSATYNAQGITGKKNLTAKFKANPDDSKLPVPVCTPPRKTAVFRDTPLTHKFYKEIDWMSCMGYSTGWRQPVGKPLYKPQDNLSREAMAAFIFRMEAPKSYRAPKVSPFADMKPGDPFYREISWMFESGLSTGWYDPAGKPTFRPKQNPTREAMAAFIYRLESPQNYKAPTVSPMADMAPGMKFYQEISWMYDVKLSTGNRTANGKEYWPKENLSRQAMAAFIYRLVLDYRK